MTEAPLRDAELDELQALLDAASPAPWESFVEGRDHYSGDNFIRLGGLDDSQPDMYVSHDTRPAPPSDQDLIAAARNYLPRLIAEVRQRRAAESS
jgi:hypothetical protein